MSQRNYTIGQVSRRTGVSVRRLRFYADEGLLPPAARSAAGYRIFTDADLVRVGLICALRSAGIGLSAIREVLSSSRSMDDILALRLAELEAQLKKQQRTAAVLRAVLSSPDRTSNDNLRRIWTMTSISAAEYDSAMATFIGEVANGQKIDDAWKNRMAQMTSITLPDEPSPEQIDAWIELRDLMTTPEFVRQMRENAIDTIARPFDAQKFEQVSESILQQARAALEAGDDAGSETGRKIAREYLDGWAAALGVEPDAEYMARMRRKHFLHQPNTDRYWQLVYRIEGRKLGYSEPAWAWIEEASLKYLETI